jgi:hypothetical protein
METLQRTANRGSISTGYDIDNSVKLERDNTEGFTFTNSGAGNRKTWTISYWFKRTELSGGYDIIAGANTGLEIGFDPNNRFQVYDGGYLFVTNRVFRDTSAFYHIVVQLDTTQSTASNRIKLYVNGVEETSLATDAPPSQNADLKWNNTGLIFYVGYFPSTNYYSNGYLADVYSIDGQALAPTEFGEFDDDTGIWIPKKYTGTYGTNGFKLEFKDSSALGTDTSGSSKSISLTNITAANQAVDSPTNNFCTINAVVGTDSTISEGATKFTNHGVNDWETFVATMGAGTSGKWYAEFQVVDHGNGDNFIGISPIDDPDLNKGFGTSFAYLGSDTSLDESVGYYAAGGNRYIGGGTASYGNSYTTTDIMSVAVDMDNGKLYFAKNGTWQNSGDPTSGSTGTGALDVRGATKPQTISGSVYFANHSMKANYGGFTTISISSAESDANGYGTFEYAPPSGYYALCTKNLAEYG